MITADTFYGGSMNISLTTSGYFLTPLSPRFLLVTVANAGSPLRLPDARMMPLTPGACVFAIWVLGTTMCFLKDYDNESISVGASMPAGRKAKVHLLDNSTAAGVWIAQ